MKNQLKFIANFWFVLLVIMGSSQFLKGQGEIGIQDLAGFPQFVGQGQPYLLEAYIYNTGQTPLSPTDTITVKIEYNQNYVHTISVNVIPPTVLMPGDSFLWGESYIFVPGQFSTGLNDILVWPESPSFVSTGATKEIFYSRDKPALKISNDLVNGLPTRLVDPGGNYLLSIGVENVGTQSTENPIEIYLQLDSQLNRYYIGQLPLSIEPGNVEVFYGASIDMDDVLNQLWAGSGLPASFSLCAIESPTMPSAQVATFDFYSPTSRGGEIEKGILTFYPNPASGNLELYLSDESISEVEEVIVTNSLGQGVMNLNPLQIASFRKSGQIFLDISQMKVGIYFVKAVGRDQSFTGKFLKK